MGNRAVITTSAAPIRSMTALPSAFISTGTAVQPVFRASWITAK